VSKAKEVEEEIRTIKSGIKTVRLNNIELFVIHHCEGESKEGENRMQWQNVNIILLSS
jgi:hypothetical protein